MQKTIKANIKTALHGEANASQSRQVKVNTFIN